MKCVVAGAGDAIAVTDVTNRCTLVKYQANERCEEELIV